MFVYLTRSLLSGLMWFVYDGQFNIRHTCEHGDHLQRYGWIRHDGTSFGQQEIIDNGERISVMLFSWILPFLSILSILSTSQYHYYHQNIEKDAFFKQFCHNHFLQDTAISMSTALILFLLKAFLWRRTSSLHQTAMLGTLGRPGSGWTLSLPPPS